MAVRLSGGQFRENSNPDLLCLPDVEAEYLGWKQRALFGDDSDVVLEHGFECLQGLGDPDGFRIVPVLIDCIAQVN